MTDYMKDIESRYYAYLYRTGDANLDTYREYLSTYLPFIQPNTDVLDLGCGAGDFLEIVSQKQCRATGVDNDSGMLKLARERGLTIIDADAIRYISTESYPESYDFIFADNFIEHLPPNVLIEMLVGCFRVLRPSGRLLVGTPNPESLHVHRYEFWRDLTHVRLYNSAVVEFLFHDTGFTDITSDVNPLTSAMPLISKADINELQKRATNLRKSLVGYKALGNRKLREAADIMDTLVAELHQIQHVLFYLHPPREYYVTGIKPN